jgi:hypothetical protein
LSLSSIFSAILWLTDLLGEREREGGGEENPGSYMNKNTETAT